ncbi:hypothetical protein [[Clostridium] scindens]|uniref:hypothetical protein n=1 Tax=Clostridium scindens (strain JCM 10418 / VPI 12708) TaxID=29347 RepID=UPI001D097682|nr:hypothetical protein [[Clostridium] scindens]MCB6287520.1 hypothetical protein [[Clostridium] scindens]MCB6422635.1 hypothetical protein [[Clostridium] scindens]
MKQKTIIETEGEKEELKTPERSDIFLLRLFLPFNQIFITDLKDFSNGIKLRNLEEATT